MLWRLANQSVLSDLCSHLCSHLLFTALFPTKCQVLSDLLTALHAAGFNDPAIGSAVRATTCHFQLDFQHDTLRVSVALGARIET